MVEESIVVKVVSRRMFPFVLMFGFYIILHGSSSPGGGFQGGVVVGAAYILFALGFNSQESRRRTPELSLKFLESGGILVFVGIGLAGIFLGCSFLANRVIGFPPKGTVGSLFSGGSLLGMNIGIGVHVAATVVTLFNAFLEC